MFVRAQEGPWEDSGLDKGSSELGEDSGDGKGAVVYRALLCAGWWGAVDFPLTSACAHPSQGKDAAEVTEAQRIFATPSMLSCQDNMKPGVFCMLSHFSCVRLFATLWTVAHQAPLSMGFSRQEYWWGLPVPSPGNLLNPGIKPVSPVSPTVAGGFFTAEPPGKPIFPFTAPCKWSFGAVFPDCFPVS